MTLANHSFDQRTTTDLLIGSSEETSILDSLSTLKNIKDVSVEAVLGWEPVYSSPIYLVHGSGQSKRRKCGDHVPPGTPQEALQKSNTVTVRCVDDDFDERPVASWKANVEQGTYRYIPNNGCYRTMKFVDDNKMDWYTVNRKLPERVSLSWQNIRMKKELKKQIRKELEKNCNNASITKGATTHAETDQDYRYYEDSDSRPATNSFRVCGTRSKNIKSNLSNTYQLEDEHIAHKYVLHHQGGFSKSVSDLFVKSLSSKINMLDEELKRDSKFNFKSRTESIKYSNKQKSTKKNKDNAPRIFRKEILAQEIFTVKAVGSKDESNRSDLHPLKKITPQQRLVGDIHNLSLAQFTHSHSNEKSANQPSFSSPQNFSSGSPGQQKTSNSYHTAVENTKQSLLNTLSGTNIHASANGRGTTHGLTRATTVTICGGLTSADDTFVLTHAPQQELVRNESVGGILPQVSGKRLEVVNSSHRWL